MIGKRTTTARNHIDSPAIHSEVDVIEKLRDLGGSGRGFAFEPLFSVISLRMEMGVTGKGFEVSPGPVFGGTGGPWAGFDKWRLRKRSFHSLELDMLA